MSGSQVTIDLNEVRNTCFVIMPFDALFKVQYDRVIRPAIERTGLECVRGDEIFSRQSVIQDVWHSVRTARVVLAELSGRNPNVMYEIGLAHAIGKPVVLLTREENNVAFDVGALRYLYYDPNNPFWGEDLGARITAAIERVLTSPEAGQHLSGITLHAPILSPPERPRESLVSKPPLDISGMWSGAWVSVNTGIVHNATLVIPSGHGVDFAATAAIAYERRAESVIVQESLAGRIRERVVYLVGVGYTYLRQGSSVGYALDVFDLVVDDDGAGLTGSVKLRHGTRPITFCRASAG